MQEAFPKACLKIYRRNLASNGIVVALPSLGKKYLPYFTRAKWHYLFPDKCFIACADPSLIENSTALNGSWFLDKKKGSRLIDLADWLNCFIKKNVNEGKAKVVFAGSSMGGYASIYLANLIEGSFAFAECPQINLYNYRGSREAIEYIAGDNDTALAEHVNLIHLFKRLSRVPNVHIMLPATDVQHYRKHVVPYARAVGDYLRKEKPKSVYFKVSIEHGKGIPFGHAPIPKKLFKENIDNLFYEMKSESAPTKGSMKDRFIAYILSFIG